MTGRNLLLIIFKWVGKSLAPFGPFKKSHSSSVNKKYWDSVQIGEYREQQLELKVFAGGKRLLLHESPPWILGSPGVAVASRISHPSSPTHSVAQMSWTKSWVNVDSYTENWTRGPNLIIITLRAKVSHLWFVSSVRRLKKLSARRWQDGWAAQPGVFTLRVVWTPTRH